LLLVLFSGKGDGGMAELFMKDEVFAIVGAAMEVHRELGPGFLEAVYQEALELEMRELKICFEAQRPLRIFYKNRPLNKVYYADLFCFGQIIVELKVVEQLSNREVAQILNYLRATGSKIGLLVNFGSRGKLEWKRFIR